MNRFHRSSAVIALALASALAAAPARADSNSFEQRARALHRSASTHFEAGRLVEAQTDFSAGYELSHKPGFLWNMAECARLLGHSERALELYRQYVAATDVASPQRIDAQRHIRELEASRASVIATSVAATPAPTSSPSTARTEDAALANRHASKPGATDTPPTANVIPNAVFVAPRDVAKEGSRPITTRWWFWTAAAGVAAIAIVSTAVVANGSGSSQPSPTIPSGNTVVSWR